MSHLGDVSRRHFLQRGAAFSMGFVGLHAFLSGRHARAEDGQVGPAIGYGSLQVDPAKVIDLPAGFAYRIISRGGESMADGLWVPGQPDGMASFPGPGGTTVLIRNHELQASWVKKGAFGAGNELLAKIDQRKLYDAGGGKFPSLGGTTTLIYDTHRQQTVKQWMSLAGTNRNCAGGPTPWGSWLTCEEDVVNAGEDGAEKNHGYVFEVPTSSEPTLFDAHPILPMGRFMHEAVCIDPRTGIVYMTEDRGDGLIYRYIPKQPGQLHLGGRLQALVVRDQKSCDTSNWAKKDATPGAAPNLLARITPGQKLAVRWMDLEQIDAPKDDLRHRGFDAGAARFARGEGMWWGHAGAYFAATTGGRAEKGQIWKYTPSAQEGEAGEEASPGVLELFIEPDDGHIVENADNITVAPWGDLIVCEDSAGEEVEPGNRLLGVTPEGKVYVLAKNAVSESEFAGVNFSPDGTTMFVNIQGDGLTLAVTGAWRKV
jgi:uncharacterized protein